MEPLSAYFNDELVVRIAQSFVAVDPTFKKTSFVKALRGQLDDKMLLDRARTIARGLHAHLPPDFERAAKVITASLGPELNDTEELGFDVFFYLPHVAYVAEFGVHHFETAMALQYELTKRFSAEFSIRIYLEKYPERSLALLRAWARDENPHVRRLVSEGTRPRLPWASRLREFQRDPSPIMPLLDLLKDDPVLYVRRSVANNLNDVSKDHPELAVDVCERWLRQKKTPERVWITKHALRSLLKQGHPRALGLLGIEDNRALDVKAKLPKTAKLGGHMNLEITIHNRDKVAHDARVDLVVGFMGARGQTRPKVFRGKVLAVEGGASTSFTKSISLASLTTRKHYAGVHPIAARVNGRTIELGKVDVRD